jgi:hypothetical protein
VAEGRPLAACLLQFPQTLGRELRSVASLEAKVKAKHLDFAA